MTRRPHKVGDEDLWDDVARTILPLKKRAAKVKTKPALAAAAVKPVVKAPPGKRVKAPVMALQATFSNEKRERKTMVKGQSTPYLEMVRRAQPKAAIEIVADTGHFPQLDEIAQTNALLQSFVSGIKG